MNTNHKLIIGGLVLVAIAFYGGSRFAAAKTTPVAVAGVTTKGSFGGGMMRGGRVGGGAVIGSIISKDATSMTIKLASGGSTIVFFDASTTISKITTGTEADLTTGLNVLVGGTPNADGSMTARSVELRPAPLSR